MTGETGDALPGDGAAGGADDAELHRDSARIEQLLDELKAMAGPPAWQRIEELVTALVGLYGAGLERLLRAAREAARDPGELAGRLCDDDLLSSLLMLHDLHPRRLEERLGQVLDRFDAGLDARVELTGIDPQRIVHLRATGAGPSWPSARAALERSLADAAPEIAGVTIEVAFAEGAHPAAAPAEPLVHIDLARSRRNA